MAWLSFVIVALVFFAPPLDLSRKMCCSVDGPPVVLTLAERQLVLPGLTALFVSVFISWFLLWALLNLLMHFFTPGPVDEWIARLINATQPLWAVRLSAIASTLVLALAMGGLWFINYALGTSYKIDSRAVIIAVVALIAEFGRLLEIAGRDERGWRQRARPGRPTI